VLVGISFAADQILVPRKNANEPQITNLSFFIDDN
jgi:hypothetical protein